MAVRVFHNDATYGWIAEDSDVADGIAWAAQHGARVINLSLGGPGSSLTLCNAVEFAMSSYHAAVVVAAGNSGVATPEYPAACPGAIGVAATDNADQRASFSNYGSPDVFVAAPGVGILSTYPAALPLTDCAVGDPVGYCRLDGTSMAAPFVSGVAALIVSLHPEVSPAAVRQMLATSSDKVGPFPYGTDPYGTCAGCTWQQDYGYGRVNLARALSTAAPPPPPPPPPLSVAPARCVDPRTIGKTLITARRRLVASHCRVGKVRYVFSKRVKRGLVISQKPLLGAVRPRAQRSLSSSAAVI